MRLLHAPVLLTTALIVSVALGLGDHSNQVAAQGPVAEWEPTAFSGKIVALTEDAVVIKPAGELKITVESRRGEGTVTKMVYVQDNKQAPKRFVFSDRLLPRPNGASPVQFGHNITDLRVGDLVTVGQWTRVRGVDYCNTLEIYRRPGGKVPPVVEDKNTSVENRWDTRMNAAQAREEKAVAAIIRLGLRLPR
jgi:hypothetical protein